MEGDGGRWRERERERDRARDQERREKLQGTRFDAGCGGDSRVERDNEQARQKLYMQFFTIRGSECNTFTPY